MVNGTGTSLQPVGDSEDATAAQKSVLVAELAEAISNQFNNIMMAVTSYAELEIKKSTSPEKRALEQIAANAGRATTLIQMLLSLSRKHNRSPRVLSVNELLRNSWSLVRHLVGDEIDVVLDLDPTLLDVKADPVDIEQ